MIPYLFYILFFFVPLIFYPKTSEVFEFNKMVFTYAITVLIMAAWIIKMIRAKKLIFKKTFLDIPLLIFLVSQLISTILSIDTRTSFLGYYSRFNGGFLSSICYALLYWAFVSNMTKEKTQKFLKLALVSATIVSIYGIMEHFGASVSCLIVRGQFNDECWVQDVRTRVFATLGQPNWLAAYLVAFIPVSWYFAFKAKLNKEKIIWGFLSLLFFACILFTRSRSGLLGLAAAIFVFTLFNLKKYFKELFILGILFSSLVLIFGTDVTPSITEIVNKKPHVATSVDTSEGGTESGSIRAIVWKGAIDIWRHYPIFGTGVETFGYSYWAFRPIEHNNTSEWDYLYNKAHNEYLNFAANTGAVGLISYLVLIGGSIYVLRKKPAFLAGYISILVTNFFGFSVVIISLITFLMPAVAQTLEFKDEKEKEAEVTGNQNLYILGVVVVTGFLLFITGRYWYADILYNLSQGYLSAGSYQTSIKNIQAAVALSPTEGIYHNEMARIFDDVAIAFIDQNDATTAAKIMPYAISESDSAFNLSPRNMNVRETRMSIYLEAAKFDPTYLQTGIDFINDTIPFSPTDPKLHLLLGKTYANAGKFDEAINQFKIALKLKPDYDDAKQALQVIQKLRIQTKEK